MHANGFVQLIFRRRDRHHTHQRGRALDSHGGIRLHIVVPDTICTTVDAAPAAANYPPALARTLGNETGG